MCQYQILFNTCMPCHSSNYFIKSTMHCIHYSNVTVFVYVLIECLEWVYHMCINKYIYICIICIYKYICICWKNSKRSFFSSGKHPLRVLRSETEIFDINQFQHGLGMARLHVMTCLQLSTSPTTNRRHAAFTHCGWNHGNTAPYTPESFTAWNLKITCLKRNIIFHPTPCWGFQPLIFQCFFQKEV